MSDRSLPRTGAGDDWLEALLDADGAEHRASYLDDDGFTARTMSSLPAPVTLPAWRRPALAVLWAAAGVGIALALPGAVTDFAREVMRVMLGQPVSLTGIAAALVALGAMSWVGAAVALRDD